MKREYKLKIKELAVKIYGKYGQIISYLFFGVLTTVVNYIVYGLFLHIFGVGPEDKNELLVLAANAIAWVAAVIFAFVTNKLYVFKSKSREKKTITRELSAFVAARLVSLGAETGIIFVGLRVYEWLGTEFSYKLWTWGVKAAASVVVIILNYVFSKLFIFKKTNGDSQ